MQVLIVFAGLVAFVASQQHYKDEIPIPYSFRYLSEGEEGTSTHEESGDAQGRKVGAYSYTDLEGNTRRVEYTAGEEGFNAVIRTNEPGTANQNPANVIMESSAPDAHSGAVSYSGGVSSRSAGISSQPRPRPVSHAAPSTGRAGGGVAYVLVPVSEAGGYY